MVDLPSYTRPSNAFEQAGGIEGITRLCEYFYEEMDSWPQAAHIRAMHVEDLSIVRDKLICFLVTWLGGPPLFIERYGRIDIPEAHLPWQITRADGEAWLGCMARALLRMDYAPEFSQRLLNQLSMPTERIIAVSRMKHGHSN